MILTYGFIKNKVQKKLTCALTLYQGLVLAMIIKNIYVIFYLLMIQIFLAESVSATLSYSMTPSVSGYSPLSGGTNIPDLGAGSDLTITPSYGIGFNFLFDGVVYTRFQASDNGYIHLCNAGGELTGTGYGNGSGDVIIPNDFSSANTLRPFIAPLWEELAIAGLNGGGSASYTITGSSPLRVLTIEWNKVSWRAPTSTNQISFQVKLYETSNIIDFIYMIGTDPLGSFPTASIGIAGIGNTNFYSLNNFGNNPAYTLGANTTSINTLPTSNGQRYRWIPTASLPIKLISFTGKNTEAGNLLEWKTATEINNDYFTIERSTDAHHFEPIAFIQGAGNNFTTKSYEYTDVSLPESSDILYYRLKQTDFNRTEEYSPIIEINASSSHKKPPQIYYDKGSEELVVYYNSFDPGKYNIEIIDMLGNLIYQYPLEIISPENKMWKISLPFHSEGIYIAKISGQKEVTISQTKFLK